MVVTTTQASCYTATRIGTRGPSRSTGSVGRRKSLTCREVSHAEAFYAILKELVETACKPCAGVPHAWQGWRFALPLHPSRPSVDTWEPSGGSASRHRPRLRPGDPPMGLRAPWNPDQGASPLEPDEGLSCPCDHSPGLSRPGTHDQSFRALDDEQAAFEPLHPDEGYSPPRPRAGHTVPAPRPGFAPDTTMERPLSR